MGTSRYVGNYREKSMWEKNRKLCEKNHGLKCEYTIDVLECVEGGHLKLDNLNYEIGSCRIDCTLNKIKYIKVSGYIKNEFDKGVKGIMVSLLKQVICNSELTYLNKGDAISDTIGYFQFVIYRDYDVGDYIVKISDGSIID